MAGQDAANAAAEFGKALPLTGVILTKADGDARGGAALSVRHITGVPIKFLGIGEDVGALEVFQPDRIVGRILGMGDVLALVLVAQQKDIDQEQGARHSPRSSRRAKRLSTSWDYWAQLTQVMSMGGRWALHAGQAAGRCRHGRQGEPPLRRMTRN